MKKKFSNWIIGITLLTLMCAASILLVGYTKQEEQIAVQKIANSQDEIQVIETTLSLMQDIETGYRGFVITGNEKYEQPLLNANERLPRVLDRFKKLIRDNGLQKNYFSSLSVLINKKIELSELIINTRRLQGQDAALKLVANGGGKIYMDSIRGIVDLMLTQENKVLKYRKAELRNMVLHTDASLILTFISFSLLLFFLLKRTRIIDIVRRKAEQQLIQSEEKFKLIIDNIKDYAIYMVDENGTILTWNSGAENLKGYTASEAIGKNISIFCNAEDQESNSYLDHLQEAREKGGVKLEALRLRKDGSAFWADIVFTAVYNEEGKFQGFVKITRDVSERRKAEEHIKESERNLNAILCSSQEGLYMLDTDYKMVLMNEALRAAIKPAAIKECKNGENFPECFNEEIKKSLLINYAKVLQGQQVKAERKTVENGIEIFYCTTYFPVKDEKGVITNICCSTKNITEERKTEETIKAANAEKEEFQYRFQSILDNSPQGVLIKDLTLNVTFANKSFVEAFGVSQKDIIGKSVKEVFNDKVSAAKFDEADSEVITSNTIKEWEQKFAIANGDVRDLQVSEFPIYDRQHNLFGIGTIFQDMTDIKTYQANLIVAREKAEQAEMLQEQFLANMSHELRTPMNGIIGMSNVLSGTSLEAGQQQKLQVIKQSSATLLNLLNDILDLSKIKAGMLTIEKTDFDFNEVVAGTASTFKERTLEKGIRLFVQTEPFIPKVLSGDSHRLIQILNNLLSNSIKFTSKGFVKLEAYLKEKTDKQATIEFIISDSGIGIEESKLETIFNSFSQASSDISRKYGGTGLGLPITRRLIELQGGEITVESTFGKGSVFTFCIPYDISENTLTPIGHSVITNVKTESKRMYAGKHALIVEDNEINQDVLVATLKQYNITSEIANNGKEAVELLERNQKFDIVFLDLRMPVMNGFQTTAYIRQKLQLQIPIVILTASVLRNERERCMGIGADDYMSKPFNPAHLDVCLQKFLGNGRLEVINKMEPACVSSLADAFQRNYNIRNLIDLKDKESIERILQLFIDKVPEDIADLKGSIQQNDQHEFLEKTHRLKGSFSIIQVPEIYNMLVVAEELAKNNKELGRAIPIFDKALSVYSAVIPNICKEVEDHLLCNYN